MTDYALSRKAALALEDIFVHTFTSFWQAQAEAYHDSFHRIFELIGDYPFLWQSASEIIAGMRKYRHQSLLIFYTTKTDEITIQHVLHYAQNVRKHMLEQ